MKFYFLFITVFCFSLITFAQSQIKLTDTLIVKGINKTESFENCLEWVAINFNSPKNVIQYQNSDRGKIILKALVNDEFQTEFVLSVTFNENGWFYTFSNIKSITYNYDKIKGINDCYTKQCRNNYKKWEESLYVNFNLLIQNINKTVTSN